MDILGEWITTCCTVAPDVLEAKTTIYLSYRAWADSNGHGQLSSSSLSRRLASRGIKVAEDKRHYRGLKVLR